MLLFFLIIQDRNGGMNQRFDNNTRQKLRLFFNDARKAVSGTELRSPRHGCLPLIGNE